MKTTILLCLLVIALPLTAQESRYYAGFHFSPGISELVILKGDVKELVNESAKIRPAYTFGIIAGLRMNGLLSFESGIQYSLHGSQTAKTELIYEEPDPLLDGFEKVRSRTTFGYLGIPLKLRINGKSGKYAFTASAGIIPNYRIVSYSKTILYGDQRSVHKYSYDYGRDFTLTSIVTAGVSRQITENACLIVEPAFQFDLIPLGKDSYNHHWNFGLSVGILILPGAGHQSKL